MRPILGRVRRASLSAGPGPKSSACAWRLRGWGAALGEMGVGHAGDRWSRHAARAGARAILAAVKLFTGGIATESNTFSPIPTGLDDYAIFRGSGRRPRSWARRSLPTPTTPSGRPTSSGSSPTPPPGGRGSIRQLRPGRHLSAARMENSFKRRPGGTRGNRDDEPRGRRGLEDPELVVEPRRPLSGQESRPVADVTLRQGGTSTSVVPRFDPRTDGSTRSVASRVAASPTSHTGDRPPIGTSVWTRGGDWRPGSAVAH